MNDHAVEDRELLKASLADAEAQHQALVELDVESARQAKLSLQHSMKLLRDLLHPKKPRGG